ncbi:hypothetical protein BB558_000718 [Smittium angustum]|uniref:triacylglycerol lipase n=1 Tax=Smittium angustum TaxID=133377 RepID=A0A2U1JDR8_SMIAN|nr:hypothetical protein BB558_000718 [Smittium angustum]
MKEYKPIKKSEGCCIRNKNRIFGLKKLLFSFSLISIGLISFVTIFNVETQGIIEGSSANIKVKRQDQAHDLSLVEIYVQEKPSREYLERYFESNQNGNNGDSEKSFNKNQFLRLKRWKLKKSNDKHKFDFGNDIINNPLTRYYINLFKRKPHDSTLSTRQDKMDFDKAKPMYQDHFGVYQTKTHLFNNTNFSGSENEILQSHFEFLSSEHGKSKSFWTLNEKSDLLSTRNKFDSHNNKRDEDIPTSDKDSGQDLKDGLKMPNMNDKNTIINFAKMAANSYTPNSNEEWETLDNGWVTESDFGWDSNGLRGHVFATENNDTIVIAFKGTSLNLPTLDRTTAPKDKHNDNLLFSCCCGRTILFWRDNCRCKKLFSKCDSSCVKKVLEDNDLYVHAGAKIVADVSKRYPNSLIMLTGHSLGAAIATISGLTFGFPAVGFGSPGDMLAAKRLGIPMPENMDFDKVPIYHIGNSADPVFMGDCNGITSLCHLLGYQLETKCHLGRTSTLDTKKYLNWRLFIQHHEMSQLIKALEQWETERINVPISEYKFDPNCQDCGTWNFV